MDDVADAGSDALSLIGRRQRSVRRLYRGAVGGAQVLNEHAGAVQNDSHVGLGDGESRVVHGNGAGALPGRDRLRVASQQDRACGAEVDPLPGVQQERGRGLGGGPGNGAIHGVVSGAGVLGRPMILGPRQCPTGGHGGVCLLLARR